MGKYCSFVAPEYPFWALYGFPIYQSTWLPFLIKPVGNQGQPVPVILVLRTYGGEGNVYTETSTICCGAKLPSETLMGASQTPKGPVAAAATLGVIRIARQAVTTTDAHVRPKRFMKYSRGS